MKSRLSCSIVLCFLTVTFGCARARIYYPADGSYGATTSSDPESASIYREKIKQLEQELVALSRTVDKTEAMRLAHTAIHESAVLAEEYQLVRPAIAHNLLVVLGIKDRGLCYQWTEDLMQRLQALRLRSFRLNWGVAYRGSELREHNSIVITARGQSFAEGIVLDPWRNSGNLYWAHVNTDSYPWQVLPPSEW